MNTIETISGKYIKNLLKKRLAESHKGTYGKVLIIAGSEGMAGAAVLSARGALRAGAGLVKVSIDKKLFPIVQAGIIEATCMERKLSANVLNEFNSVVLGPGLGNTSEGAYAVAKVMEHYEGNLVMDADTLNIVSDNDIDLMKIKGNAIITPHPGEAAKLIKTNTQEINANREKAVTFLAGISGAVSVLKGHDTLVCIPQKSKDQQIEIYVNPTGNPGMATGGSGDVLSGIIGSFLGQGMSPKDAALAGVYVHGRAGDLASSQLGEYGIIAGDIAHYTARAIKDIQESSFNRR